jgi:hypothetical protein
MTSCFFAAGGQRREKSAEGAKKQQPVILCGYPTAVQASCGWNYFVHFIGVFMQWITFRDDALIKMQNQLEKKA